ncbi:MAG: FMN reductase [Marinomonas sp.]|jgi:flavin reductase|uniref:flavin reductase n=1 Tax=Marinomonas communis TaxID=28254 RepID=UPI000C58D6D0|nr:flavin reductase [Marinomonas communis]MAF15534.1 FMN reductase [Marinomonas sp.]MCC4273080.1 flavin reductase [Marinomonas communis]
MSDAISTTVNEQTAAFDVNALAVESPIQKEEVAKLFREGMSRLGASVNVITTMTPAGPVGFTATAVTSVTDTPPTLLVCLNRSSSVFSAFDQAEHLCVNVLGAGQEAVSGTFASKLTQPERFELTQWQPMVTGAPSLSVSATAFDCRIASRNTVGTHEVFFCEVLAVGLAEEATNLVYFNRKYQSLS